MLLIKLITLHMKYGLLLVIATCFASTSFSQAYSYSFEARFDSDDILALETSCRSIRNVSECFGMFQNVSECKVKYKYENGKGEIMLRPQSIKERKEVSESFSPVDVKQVLIDHGATHLEFIQLND